MTSRLLEFRDSLRSYKISGYLLLDGSYVSAKSEPDDFDVLLVGPATIQVMKDGDSGLATLLDAEHAENVGGYTLFFIPNNSPSLPTLITLWDISAGGVEKGVVEVEI